MLLEDTPALSLPFPACINTYEVRAKNFPTLCPGGQTKNHAAALTVRDEMMYRELFR